MSPRVRGRCSRFPSGLPRGAVTGVRYAHLEVIVRQKNKDRVRKWDKRGHIYMGTDGENNVYVVYNLCIYKIELTNERNEHGTKRFASC